MRMLPLALLVAAGCAPKAPPAAPAAAADEAGPRLVVMVVVDQLPTRLLDAAAPHAEGGLARLLGEQAYVGAARYSHAITFTCPGHATLSTGAPPSVHGIVSNDWLVGGERVYCAEGQKIDFLRAEPLADRVRAAGGLVASASLKDRGAILLGGHDPSLVTWYDGKAARFTGPDWVNEAARLPERMAEPWSPLHPDVYAARGPDAGPFEAHKLLGTEFPHPSSAEAGAGAFLFTPSSGTALTDVAIAAVDQLGLGADATPDLLTVSYSQIDYIGHAYSSESWETLDGLLRLDQDLARLFAHLDAKVGDDWAVVFSSDHGAGTPGELWVGLPDLVARADAALAAAGFPTGVKFEDPSLWLPDAVRADPAQRAPAAAAVAAAISDMPGIAQAHPWRDGELDAGPAHADAIRASLDAERSGDLYVLLEPGALYIYSGSPRTGTSHGTPYEYDVRVPVLAWGDGVAPGRATTDHDVRQVAPTAAALLGVPAPAQATEPPIGAALR